MTKAHAADAHLDLSGNSGVMVNLARQVLQISMRMHRYARVTIRRRQTDIARLNRWLEQQEIELSDKFGEVAVQSLQETDPPARLRARISLNH